MMTGLDSELDKKKREKILENCGRNCISRDLVRKAQACRQSARNMDDFLNRLAKNWSHLQRDGNKVHIVYEKCYCPLLRGHTGVLSKTFCNCSRGYIIELFESAIQRPVRVTLEKSIRQGDNICRFEVHLPKSFEL
jgi:predicted hydrocarbon binding protein